MTVKPYEFTPGSLMINDWGSLPETAIKVSLHTSDPSVPRVPSEFDDDIADMRAADGSKNPAEITWPSASSGTAWGGGGGTVLWGGGGGGAGHVVLSDSDTFTINSSVGISPR